MIIGVPKETFPGEKRVALVPSSISSLVKKGLEVQIETGAGVEAGFSDSEYTDKGAKIVSDRKAVFKAADVVLQVRALGANPEVGKADLELLKKGQVLIACSEPLSSFDANTKIAEKGVTAFSMEMMPRITRAQSMDVLSSGATVAGYKAVLMAASELPKFFPMFMTAAGTISPAKVLIVGVGVAGLQAIATARRLGAVVSAYDIRPAVKEQVESLGAKFVEMELETGSSEDKGGYAKEMDEEFYKKQRELMTKVIADSDVVITTAAVPGKKAPILVTADMLRGMVAGSVLVDLAAERGGNCELTKPGETVVDSGVTIMGPLNVATTIPYHASQMYARNITTFLLHLLGKEVKFSFDMDDEITAGTLVSKDGEILHPFVRKLMGLPEIKKPQSDEPKGE